MWGHLGASRNITPPLEQTWPPGRQYPQLRKKGKKRHTIIEDFVTGGN
jgi:hypothetical protein